VSLIKSSTEPERTEQRIARFAGVKKCLFGVKFYCIDNVGQRLSIVAVQQFKHLDPG
jgi:hypothetical protein